MTTPRVTVPVDAVELLKRHMPMLEAAASPAKSEVFVVCGHEAREIHDAIARLSSAPAPEGGAVDVESGIARTAIVNVVERYVTGGGGQFADNPYDAAPHLARELLAALATREEAPAGDAARIIACHLPLADAPDTVCLPITMTAGDLRTVYAALRAQPPASPSTLAELHAAERLIDQQAAEIRRLKAREDALRVASLPRFSPTSTGNNAAMMQEDEAGLYVLRKQVFAVLQAEQGAK